MMGFTGRFLVELLVLIGITGRYASALRYGECSQKWEVATKEDELGEGISLSSCSKSSSCVTFEDCCYDSPFKRSPLSLLFSRRKKIDRVSKVRNACLRVDNHGSFSVIRDCPSTWKHSEYCRGGIGHLPPVTSLSTGASYANIFCAECHDDSLNVARWDVQLRCCSGKNHDLLYIESLWNTKVGFHFLGNELWKWVENGGSRFQCPCRFESRSSKSFVPKSTELRSCPQNTISTCSPFWTGEQTREECSSYLDPVYIHDRVFRNLHCAKCNHENAAHATCVPDIVMRLRGRKSRKEIQKICEFYHHKPCLHFLTTPKGDRYSFSRLFTMNQKECFPDPKSGVRCCDGKLYDHLSKQCKNVTGRDSNW